MESLGKIIEANYFIIFEKEEYSRVSEFNTENNKQKVTWYYQGEMSWEKVEKFFGEKLEMTYDKKTSEMFLKKTHIDVEERIVYKDILYLRTFTNWPRGEETCWMTRDTNMEKDLSKQLLEDGMKRQDMPNMSFWGNNFSDPEMPNTLEREYQNKFGSV